MNENWDKKIGSFDSEIEKIKKVTGDDSLFENIDKEKTLAEFLKKDKQKLRALLAILKKSESDQGEIDFSKEIRSIKIIDALDAFIDSYKNGEQTTLEPRQVESLVKISTFLHSGKKRGYLELPTGLGKTVIFSELIEAIKDIEGIRVLVVGSGNINAMQNSQKIEIFGDEEVGQYFAGKKDLSAKVVVCNYNGLRNAIANSEIDGETFDLILLDETHDGLGEVTQKRIEESLKDQTMIGFTATAQHKLSRGISVRDFLPVEIDNLPIVEAVESNLLSAFDVEVVEIPNTMKSIRVSGGDYDLSSLDKNINTPERNNLIVDSYINFYQKAGNRTIAFCVGIQHAKDLTETFIKKGVKAGCITSELNLDEREAILQKLKDGTIEVLVGSKLIWQALDETELTIGLNVAPSLSEKDVTQRAGRMLRRSEKQDRKRAKIVEFLDEWRGIKNRPIFYSEVLQTVSAQPKKWAEEDMFQETNKDSFEEKTSFWINYIKDIPITAPSDETLLNTSFTSENSTPINNQEEIEENIENQISDETIDQIDVQINTEEDQNKPEKKEKQRVIRHKDAKKILSISNENRKFRNEGYYEYAPKGWMSVNIMAVELGVSKREIEQTILLLKQKNFDKIALKSKVYLSALGIKRNFYEPKVVDMIYKELTLHTREEKIKRGDIVSTDLSDLEQIAVEQEKRSSTSHEIDLDWKDYDLTPSFTLEGESLDDEEEGVNIYDTSELHAYGEPIQGSKFDDIVGYFYYSIKGKVLNHKKQPNISPETKNVLLNKTDRYGLRPNEDLEQIMQVDFESTTSDEFAEKEDSFKYIMEVIENDLSEREREIIKDYFLTPGATLELVASEHGSSTERIRQILRSGFRRIRKALKRRDTLEQTRWSDEDEESSIFNQKKEEDIDNEDEN